MSRQWSLATRGHYIYLNLGLRPNGPLGPGQPRNGQSDINDPRRGRCEILTPWSLYPCIMVLQQFYAAPGIILGKAEFYYSDKSESKQILDF